MSYTESQNHTENSQEKNSYTSTKNFFPNMKKVKPMKKVCEKHGEYLSYAINICGKLIRSRCPECEKEDEKREQEKREQLKINSINIPARFKDKTFDSFRADGEELQSVKDICIRFSQSQKAGRALVLVGASMKGKTLLASATLKECAEDNKYYITLAELFSSIKSSYSDRRVDTDFAIEKFVKFDVLCIDNMETFYPSPDNKKLLFEIVNRRYNNMKSTIYCTNLPLDEFVETIGEGLFHKMTVDGYIKEIP
jgi:DNA replication protein DnaC